MSKEHQNMCDSESLCTHVTRFSPQPLRKVCTYSGFHPVVMATSYSPHQLFLLCHSLLSHILLTSYTCHALKYVVLCVQRWFTFNEHCRSYAVMGQNISSSMQATLLGQTNLDPLGTQHIGFSWSPPWVLGICHGHPCTFQVSLSTSTAMCLNPVRSARIKMLYRLYSNIHTLWKLVSFHNCSNLACCSISSSRCGLHLMASMTSHNLPAWAE